MCSSVGEVESEKNDGGTEKVSDAAVENTAENIDRKNDVAAKEMNEENNEKEKSGSGSDEEGKWDNVDGSSKEIGSDKGGSILDGEQSVLSTTENEQDLVSSEPSDSETSSRQNESEKGCFCF